MIYTQDGNVNINVCDRLGPEEATSQEAASARDTDNATAPCRLRSGLD